MLDTMSMIDIFCQPPSGSDMLTSSLLQNKDVRGEFLTALSPKNLFSPSVSFKKNIKYNNLPQLFSKAEDV